ncbi:MAX dimerization protein MGA a isoform X5 [Hypanus sabinus]|uniref:MAX dimerization protein MGA a isoform X5 n=1 Tax=Hypanus sabinus TaxID=79690 RepID=UPI0028C4A6CD|nr:MAX dimerization protein MGA a isoform X5 [Hypanus sabinus]
MEKQQPEHTEQESNAPANSGTPAAYFVLVKKAGGSSGTERSMVVAKQELGGIGCLLEKSNRLMPGTASHPFECHSGNVCVTLENQEMWNQFYKHGTEMVLTKRGRRMFPYCRFCLLGLDPLKKYILVMDIAPVDNQRYKWNGQWWELNGKAEPHVLGRVYIHPNSPSSGSYWMRQPISFHKLKLTNNTLDQEGHIILHSMHRYLPRLHIISADKSTDVISLSGPNVHTFTFPQTEFVAVTAYQNMRITQLKIDFNPFAKGFRDEGLNSRPMRELRHQGSELMDADCSDDSASCSSVATESSEHLRFKTEEESEHRKKQGNTHTFPNSSLDGGLSNTEDEDFLEEDMPKINNPCGEKSNMKKRSTESILKCLPNIYSTSSEDHEEPFNIIVKEEPPDDYEYNCAANSVDLDCGGLKCKEEEEYLDSEEQHDKTNYELINKTIDKTEVGATSPAVSKQPLKLPTEVAPKAKMLQLQSIKVPVVCLEPCFIPKGTIKISEIPQKLLSPCRRSGGPLPTIVHSAVSAEKHTCSPSSAEKPQVKNVDSTSECSRHKERSLASEITENKTHISTVENIPTASHSTPSGKSSGEGFRFRKIKFTEKARNSTLWMSSTRAYLNSTEDPPVLSNCFKSARLSGKAFSSGIWRPPDGRTCCTGETSMPRTNWKSSAMSTRQAIAGACRRRRTKKLRLSAKSSRSVLGMSSLASSKHLEREKTFQDASPDLDDVEGVTFVSYASQDALQSHLVEKMPEDQSSSIYPIADPQETEEEKIERLEEQLLENLAHLNPRVIMHPLLEQAGLKPSSLLSTGGLNLKHLGVVISPSASIIRTAQRDILKPSPIKEVRDPSEEVSFVSRTGKTNDFTKLKGWKHKLAQQSESSPSKQVEASTNLEASMKNRSVFSSDKLDEYLENEEKIIKERAALCVNKMSKVVYEMPTKSSSYIRTLDSVLKHRATQANTRESPSSCRTSVSPQSIPAGSVSKSKKQSGTIVEHDSASKAQKSVNSAKVVSTPAKSPAKSSRLQFSSSARRLPGISKKQMKLMHLENSALWSGKPRTYITEERAEASLVTLLTAQGSLSSRKRKMVSRQLPMCKNEFCRLGCICSSLSHVKQPPKHCRKPKCMLTCKCPKQKVLVLKSFARRKKQMNKALREDLIFYDALAEDEDWKPRAKKRKRKKMVRYAIPAREQPIRSYPMWVREEGEVDPEPVYTAPHIESCHADKTLSLPEESTPASSPKLSEVDEKGPVYWYFESMMTCARVRVFERKDAGKSLTCTCSPTQCCKEGNSKVDNNSAVAACKLKCCSDCKPSKESDPEKMDGLEDSSTSPNGVQKCEWKTKEKTDSPLRCNSPQGESSCFDPKEPPSTGQIKNTSKLIEIISDCNWESERTNILEVLARYTANKGISEKIRIGNFLVEIASNRGKGLDAPPGNTHISSSIVKITQPADKEEDVKNSGCNTSVQTASKSSGLKLTDLRPIAPKEKLRIPANSTLGSKEITIIQLGSTVASQQKAASDTTARKNGLMQFTRSTSGDTKLTLGQVGALHPVNWVIANLKKNVKSAEPVKWFTSSMAASSISADLPSKHTTSCTTDPASEVSRDDTNAVPSDQAKGNYTAPDNYTHLVINKVGDVGKTKSCFSSLEPVSSNQQLGTLLCRVNMNATTGSVSGICLPTPSQSSSAVPPILHPVSGIPTRGKPHSVPVKKYIRVPLKQISTIQSISSNVFEVPVATTSPAKLVTVNDLGQTINTRHLIPLQPMGLALLQLPPGQKNVPSAIITTEWPLKFMNPPSKSKSPEKAGSKITNQDGNLEEQLIEPEEIHVADSDLIETTVSEGVPDEDLVNTYPLTEVKQGTECDVLPSTPSVSEVDNELEDDSTDHRNALKHIIPAELVDHSYTSEKKIMRKGRNKKSLQKESVTTEKSDDKDTSESCHEVVDKEPDERANREVKNGVQDEQMEVETEVKESWYETTPFKREEDTLKDEENDEINFDPTLLQYADIHTESDKDTDSQSDLEDGDIQTDADEIDVEKMFDSTSSEEAVDIETVEELSEKINIARLIASASHHHTRKTKCHFHNPYLTRKSKEEYTKPKLKSTAHISKEAKAQLDALVLYRTTHTVNERRRRSKIRDLFERLKKVLGLRREERASKYLILKKAFSEIQNAQDYFDCLSAEKSIQTRRRDSLIRKVSQLTGKTDEVILKKLEYICAKQRALDAEKKKLAQKADDTRKKRSKGWNAGLNSSVDSFQKVAMDLRNQKPPNVLMQTSEQERPKTGTRKPLILTRKRSSAALYSSTTSNPTGGNLLMTPQGQVLTLKGPLISGQTSFFTAEGLLSGSQSKGDDATGTSIAGIASVTVQLQGLPVPLQVNNFAIAGSLSSGQSASAQLSTKPGMEAVSSDSADMRQGNNAKSKAPAGSVGDEASSFMMPRIVNVTSLATGEAPLMNVENMNNSLALDTQPLDFSIKGRKRRILQERLSFTTSKIPSLSIVKNSFHPAGKSTVPDESEVTSCPFSSEAEESECVQTQQIVASRSLDADNISELPKALDLSSLSDGTAVSCTGQSWTQEAAPGESSTVTEIMLGDKLELQVIGGRMQTCSIDKAGQSDREAELSSSQLLEPLLKANGTAAGDMVDTEGYEPFTSLLNELAFLNQQFSDEENPDVSSVSDHNALGFIDSGNQGDSMDELSLIHGPVLVDIDSTDGTTELKQVAGRESGCSNSPLVLQLEEDDLNVEQLLGNEMPVDSQTELDNGTLDLEGNSISGSSSSVNISPPPLIHMKATTSSANTGISSSLDMLWRPMPKLAPLGLAWGAGKAVSSVQVESRSEDSPETNKPMPALARISSPQQDSTEGPEFASGEH